MKQALFLFLLLFASNVFAQNNEWETLKTDNGEFSMQMPAGCYTHFYNKDGITIGENYDSYELKEMRLIQGYHSQTLMSVEIYKTAKPKKVIEILASRQPTKSAQTKMILPEGFKGIEIIEQNNNIFETIIFVAGKNHVYHIVTAKRNTPNETTKKFLDSAKFKVGNLLDTKEKLVLISSLKNETPEITMAEKELPATEQNSLKDTLENTKTRKEISSKNSEVKKMVIRVKPRASYTELARKHGVTGTIRLRINFSAMARITKIDVIQSLPDGLVREAIIAAMRVKFLPEENADIPISVTKVMEYNFNLY